jgi:cysteinyl-tRNA synthetase
VTRAGRRLHEAIPAALEAFRAGMDHDFGTPQAIAALYNLASALNGFKDSLSTPQAVTPTAKWLVERAFAAIEEIMGVLGLPAPDIGTGADAETTARVEELLAERAWLRAAHNFAGADAVRAELERLGVVIEDHPQGTIPGRLRELGQQARAVERLAAERQRGSARCWEGPPPCHARVMRQDHHVLPGRKS